MFSALFSGGIKGHFGQGAEDVLVRKLFPRTKKDGVYLDIGAYHPFKHSNTAWFWMKGWRGYNIDANGNVTIGAGNVLVTSQAWSNVAPNVTAGIFEIDSTSEQILFLKDAPAFYTVGIVTEDTVNILTTENNVIIIEE